MLILKASSVSLGVTATLGGAMMLVTTFAMTADAQTGRVKARGDRGVAAVNTGPAGNSAARARGCNSVEGGQNCGSSSGFLGADGAYAGRGSVSLFNEDGSFSRDAAAMGVSEYGNADRTLNSVYNADGSGQRTVNGSALSSNGFGERNLNVVVDGQGNGARTGSTSASSYFGAFSTQGEGSYTQENGLNYGRNSQASAEGDNASFYADRSSGYDQSAGFNYQNSGGGSVENENASAQTHSEQSYSRDDGLAVGRGTTVTGAEGNSFDSSLTYDSENGADRMTVCTNAAGENVACLN